MWYASSCQVIDEYGNADTHEAGHSFGQEIGQTHEFVPVKSENAIEYGSLEQHGNHAEDVVVSQGRHTEGSGNENYNGTPGSIPSQQWAAHLAVQGKDKQEQGQHNHKVGACHSPHEPRVQ